MMHSPPPNARAAPIFYSSAKILALLDEISRHRALADEETDILEAIISGECKSPVRQGGR